MQRFKNHNSHGFSFIEIVLTIALIGAITAPVFMVQYNVLGLLTRSSDRVRRIFLTDTLYNQAVLQEKKVDQDIKALSFEKKYEDPALSLRYEVTEVSEKSPLKKLKNLYAVKSKGTWQRAGGVEVQEELSFIFRPPSEKKEQAEKKSGPEEKTEAEEKGGSEKKPMPEKESLPTPGAVPEQIAAPEQEGVV